MTGKPGDLRFRTDRTLVRLILAGDESEESRLVRRRAENELVRRYQEPLEDLILMMVGNRETAEELAQDAFVKAFRALARFRPDAKLAPWLLKIARNVARDHLRKKQLETVPIKGAAWWDTDDLRKHIAVQVRDPTITPSRRVMAKEEKQRILAAVMRLPPKHRECFLYRAVEELSYDEISVIVGLPANAAREYVHRAKLILRKELKMGDRGDSADLEKPSAAT
jgi:RNA polymerase sigma-70 factor (ECF subfamily)